MTRYGNAHAMQLQEVPQPRAVDGEVLIRVQAAGLNPVDYKLRQLLGRLVWSLDLPLVAGSELSGVVEGVGEGVKRFAIGDRVFARVDKRKLGSFPSFCVAKESLVARLH